MPGPVTLLDASWNNLYGHSLPTADSSRAWRKYGHLVLVNRLRSLPRNSADRLTDRLDITLVVDWAVKLQLQTKNLIKLGRCWYFPSLGAQTI